MYNVRYTWVTAAFSPSKLFSVCLSELRTQITLTCGQLFHVQGDVGQEALLAGCWTWDTPSNPPLAAHICSAPWQQDSSCVRIAKC